MKNNIKCVLAILLVSFVLAIIAATIILLTNELTNIEFIAIMILIWLIFILSTKINSIHNSHIGSKPSDGSNKS
jgi:uncharacterized membrane protein YfcA